MNDPKPIPALLALAPRPQPTVDAIDPYIWPHVHTDYRTGLTFAKLSEKYAIPIKAIVARRRAENWRRDLSGEVRAEVNARLVAESVPLGSRGEADAVAAAAVVGVEVVKRHRAALADGIAAARNLASDLLAGSQDPERTAALLGPKETIADAMLKVANSLARLIPQERIAYGLNDREEEKPYEERLREWAQSRAERTGKV